MEEAEGSKRQKLSVTRGDGSQILVRETRDLLSGLHDDLLHHIMSFMSMEEIIRTGFLSRRWRYLWRNIPFLDFALRPSNEEDRHTGERRVSFVETLLFRHKGSRVKKLCINVDTYYINKYQVDSWIDYALDGDVEELDLDFSAEDFPGSYLPGDELLYDLPPAIYRCETLQSLKLCCCDLNLPTSIHLRSLKTLCLTAVDLPTNAISALTSNCPVLEELSLKHCNIYLNLNISIPTKHLNILRIIDQVDEFFDDTEMVIDVPNLLSLEWKGCLLRDKYHIKRLSSLLKARFDLEDALPDKLELFLHSLHHVQDLTIDCVFIQMLSTWEVQNKDPLRLNVKCLELKTGLTKWELPGILYLLRSSPELETLVINITSSPNIDIDDEIENQYDFSEREYWRSQEHCFSSLMRNVRTIKIYNFFKGWCIYQEEEDDCSAVKELFKSHEHEIELIRVLLQYSDVLERMIISKDCNGCVGENRSQIPFMVTVKVINFPRTSPNADIIFSNF